MGNTTKSTFRTVLMLPFAAIVTAGLFLFMSGMIQTETPNIPNVKTAPVITITPQLIDNPIIHPPAKPVTITDPPRPITRDEDFVPDDTNRRVIVNVPKPDTINPDKIIGGRTGIKGAFLTPKPTYPENCLARGVEGTATVVFDVTNSGHVINARVVGATDRCFERAAIRAIQKWKFHAQGDGGAGISQSNLRKTFTFEITE